MAQALFETGKHGLFVTSLDIDDAVASQSDMSDRRSKEVLPGDAPQDLAFGSRRDACRKQRRGGSINRSVAAACHLVQTPARQSSARQNAIYCLQAEREHLGPARPASFEPRYAIAKFGNDGCGDDDVHACSFQRSRCVWGFIVPLLFLFSDSRVNWVCRADLLHEG